MKTQYVVSGTILLALLALLTGARGVLADSTEHEEHMHRHKKYESVKNPVPLTEQSVRAGRAVFERLCVACHGKDAKGGIGPDLTNEQWIHGGSDGEIYHIITVGVAGTAMKGFKDELSEETRWHLVNYIRSRTKSQNPALK